MARRSILSRLEEIDQYFRTEYVDMTRFAIAILKAYGYEGNQAREMAEDAIQETFGLLLVKQEVFFAHENPVGWLYKSLGNITKRMARHENIRERHRVTVEEDLPDFSADPEAIVQQRYFLQELLAPEEFQLLHKLYVDGYDYNELCGEMGLKKSTLAMRLLRIRKRLKKQNSE